MNVRPFLRADTAADVLVWINLDLVEYALIRKAMFGGGLTTRLYFSDDEFFDVRESPKEIFEEGSKKLLTKAKIMKGEER